MGRYQSFAELASHERYGRDFRVLAVERPGSPVAVIAPHGGRIEAGTSEIAGLIAADEHSLFCFEGTKDDMRNRDLHITSHCFDHPDCLALAARCEFVLSVHGCQGEGQIFVGGLDAALAGCLTERLSGNGYAVLADGHRYPGRHPMNICNRGLRRMGAQLEITYDLRVSRHAADIARSVRTALADACRLRPPC
jgi:phage replication-related protein YjqB (UPF0714/DUF867 family)